MATGWGIRNTAMDHTQDLAFYQLHLWLECKMIVSRGESVRVRGIFLWERKNLVVDVNEIPDRQKVIVRNTESEPHEVHLIIIELLIEVVDAPQDLWNNRDHPVRTEELVHITRITRGVWGLCYLAQLLQGPRPQELDAGSTIGTMLLRTKMPLYPPLLRSRLVLLVSLSTTLSQLLHDPLESLGLLPPRFTLKTARFPLTQTGLLFFHMSEFEFALLSPLPILELLLYLGPRPPLFYTLLFVERALLARSFMLITGVMFLHG